MYGQHATDIVGYTFNADTYCPGHILTVVKATYPLDYPLASTIQAMDTAEDILSTVAKSLRIAHDDEHTFDSDEFPKVIFADSLWITDDVCAVCHETLEH